MAGGPAPLAAALERWHRELDPPLPGRHVVPPSARAIVLSAMARRLDQPVLAIVAGEREAEDLVEDVALFHSRALHLPAWETLPFEHVSPNIVTMGARIRARHALAGPEPVVVV